MRIIVFRAQGESEAITLPAGAVLRVIEGELLNKLSIEGGRDLYFEKRGYYDGAGISTLVASPDAERT